MTNNKKLKQPALFVSIMFFADQILTWLRTGYDTTIKYFESLYGIDENPPVIGLLTERKTKKGNNSKKSKGLTNNNARGASSKNKKIAQKNNIDIVTTVFSLVLRILDELLSKYELAEKSLVKLIKKFAKFHKRMTIKEERDKFVKQVKDFARKKISGFTNSLKTFGIESLEGLIILYEDSRDYLDSSFYSIRVTLGLKKPGKRIKRPMRPARALRAKIATELAQKTGEIPFDQSTARVDEVST